jgi:hypothetical protein
MDARRRLPTAPRQRVDPPCRAPEASRLGSAQSVDFATDDDPRVAYSSQGLHRYWQLGTAGELGSGRADARVPTLDRPGF